MVVWEVKVVLVRVFRPSATRMVKMGVGILDGVMEARAAKATR